MCKCGASVHVPSVLLAECNFNRSDLKAWASALFDQLRLKKNFSEVSAVNIAFLENDEKFNSLTSISRSVWLRCLLLFYRRNEEDILNIFVKKFTFLAPGNYGRISIFMAIKR